MTEDKFFFDTKDPPREDPQGRLEQSFIRQFLAQKGYTQKDLETLPKDIARALRKEASNYASCKLAEVDTRSKLVNELHGEFH